MNQVIREQNEIGHDTNSLDRIQKEKDYISYLTTHIANVKKAYETLFVPLMTQNIICDDALFSAEDFKYAILAIKDAVEHHDESKWSDAEFEPYRMHWNPTDEEKLRDQYYQDEVEEAYNNAWLHHYQNNDHHPKHWYDFENNVARDMSLGAIIHMLCDWESFYVNSGRSTVKWWIEDAEEERKFISPKTVSILEYILFNIIHPEEYKEYIANKSENLAIEKGNK